MSRLVPSRRRLLGLALGVVGVALTVPASPASAIGAYDNFKLVGGKRYVLTVSKQRQLPGVDPKIWPKGYRNVCSITQPGIQFRVNNDFQSDIGSWGANVVFAPKGTLNYKGWNGSPTTEATWFSIAYANLPVTRTSSLLLEPTVGADQAARAPLAPKLGGYDLQIVPISSIFLGQWVPFPATTLSATLSVVQGTDAECPVQTRSFYRASI